MSIRHKRCSNLQHASCIYRSPTDTDTQCTVWGTFEHRTAVSVQPAAKSSVYPPLRTLLFSFLSSFLLWVTLSRFGNRFLYWDKSILLSTHRGSKENIRSFSWPEATKRSLSWSAVSRSFSAISTHSLSLSGIRDRQIILSLSLKHSHWLLNSKFI